MIEHNENKAIKEGISVKCHRKIADIAVQEHIVFSVNLPLINTKDTHFVPFLVLCL